MGDKVWSGDNGRVTVAGAGGVRIVAIGVDSSVGVDMALLAGNGQGEKSN